MMTQTSGAGFIAVDKILNDLTDRSGLQEAWEGIDKDTQAIVIKHQLSESKGDQPGDQK